MPKKVCANCGKEFQAARCKTILCSNKCRGVYYRQLKLRQRQELVERSGPKYCLHCGGLIRFSPDIPNLRHRLKTSKYCSTLCWLSKGDAGAAASRVNKGRKGPAKVEIGEEKWSEPYWGIRPSQLMIYDGRKWVRKAVYILEESLNRKLTKPELQTLTYLDGDLSNVQLSNLSIQGSKYTIVSCRICGALRRFQISNPVPPPKVCRKCYDLHRTDIWRKPHGVKV